jgi:hypothetical protein
MRFEAKHRFSKIVGKNAYNFKDIAKTVARRLSLNLAYSLGSVNEEKSTQIDVGSGSLIKIEDIKNPIDFSTIGFELDAIFVVDFLNVNGTKIEPLKYFILASSDCDIRFCQISLCFLIGEKINIAIIPLRCSEKYPCSYIFIIDGQENVVVVSPAALDLENPLVALHSFGESHETDRVLICCPIELV